MALMPGLSGTAPMPGGAPVPGTPGAGAGVYNTGYLNQQALMMPQAEPEPMIWQGTSQGTSTRHRGGALEEFSNHVDDQINANELVLEFEAMSNKRRKQLARRLAMAGYLTGAGSLEEIVQFASLDEVALAYEDLLGEAAGRWASGQRVTPEQILDSRISYALFARGQDENTTNPWDVLTGASAVAEEDLSGTHKSVSVAADIYSASEARNLARATLRNALDRDPTEEEYEDFVAALQTQQREHPVRQVTKTTTDADGRVIRTNSTTHGGVNPEQFAYEQAQENPGYAEWNAVGTYLPVALNALASGVAGV